MGDVFLEEMVEKRLSARDRAVRGGALLAGLAAVLLMFLVLPGFPLAVVGGAVAAWFAVRAVVKRLYQEYEYALTNGSLDIDVIYNREWRRRVCSLDLREQASLIAPVADPRSRRAISGADKVRCLASSPDAPDVYVLTYRSADGERTLLWEPSPVMVEACRRVAPRVVFSD